MKKYILLISVIIVGILINTGCFNKKYEKINKNTKTESSDKNMDNITNINVTINGKTYLAEIEENETAEAFINKLPQKLTMSELNGNEKYVYMNDSLPTNPSKPDKILTGDIMLYGNDCLVIFYKTFNTNYSYTKIGHIENLPDLGSSNVVVKFEK